jgi:hypothetical protein
MKKVLYLSFYFEPDLCAGSFRNTSLAKELANQLKGVAEVEVITTMPNRYDTYKKTAEVFERNNNLRIYRVDIPSHRSGLTDQIKSFKKYYQEVKKHTREKHYDLVFASSSRLFTAFLSSSIARKKNIPLYIDVRDIFFDSLKDLLVNPIVKYTVLPIIKIIENYTFKRANHINLISGGFVEYFRKFECASFSTYSNGIDDEFISYNPIEGRKNDVPLVTYAGNIGEGQGLHKVIPFLAKKLESTFNFLVIGDGGAKSKLVSKLRDLDCKNIEIINPVSREYLMEYYHNSDYFFMHLNDFNAFKKVLPSKVFELAAMNKPIIAGVGGFAADFIHKNVSNTILFKPCDYESCASQLEKYTYKRVIRSDFIEKFKRSNINKEMASSIVSLLNN